MPQGASPARSYDVTVIGCGAMGSAIARLLRRNGHAVAAWNRTHSRAEALETDGIAPIESAVAAAAAAPVAIACQTSCDNTWASLEAVEDWAGGTFVNLTAGTAAEACEMQRWCEGRNGHYLDGVINCYPRELGSPTASILFSGDQHAWVKHEGTLRELGGGVELISGDVTMANTAQLGVTAFYIPALCSYIESASYLHDRGISAAFARELILHALDLLRDHTAEIFSAIQEDDHVDEEASLDTFTEAARLIWTELTDAGLRVPVLEAAKDSLEAAQQAGVAELGISAQSRLLRS